ncbi:MAG: hypothetical protein HY054_13630 [Proteobacteria bacterium]|nr:hypothetical protein [Pseudomonadota bacterium]
MAEIRTVTTLTSKREELERAIAGYEKALAQAQIDLSHVIATIKMLEREGALDDAPRYADVERLFKRGEMIRLCRYALSKESPLDTKQLSARVMEAKGFDSKDLVLLKAVTFRVVQAMRAQERRNTVVGAGKRHGGVRIWARAE